MDKRVIFILVFLFVFISGYSQNINFAYIDSATYKMYLDNDWKSVKKTGKKALKNDIDYYYLRMRMGIAYYNTKNYVKAIEHFEKAEEFNSGDKLLKEYLYYSYLFAGFEHRLRKYKETMPADLKESLSIVEDKPILDIYSEGGASANEDYEDLKLYEIESGYDTDDQTLPYNSRYYNLSFSHLFNEYCLVRHAYSYLNVSNLQRIKDVEGSYKEYMHKTDQNQYYISLNIPMGRSYSINAAANVLWINSYFTSVDNIEQNIPIYKNINYKSTDYVLYLDVRKRFKYMGAGLYYTNSGLNSANQMQFGSYLDFYPLGNNNLYTKTKLAVQKQKKPEPIYKQTIGGGCKYFGLELSASIGKMENYSESKAYLVYNSLGFFNKKFEVALYIPATNRLKFSLRYNRIYYKGLIERYNTRENIQRSYYDYISNSLIIGVKYRF